MLRGLDVLISCCVAVAVGDLGSDLDSELCQSDDCAAKQARTGLAAANDDDLQDPNTIAVKDADEDEEGSTTLPFLGLFLMGWRPKCVRTFWAVSRGRMLHTHSGVLWPLSSGGKWTTPVRVTR